MLTLLASFVTSLSIKDDLTKVISESDFYYTFTGIGEIIELNINASHSLIIPTSLSTSDLTIDFLLDGETKMTKSLKVSLLKGVRFVDSGKYTMKIKFMPGNEDSITTLYVFPKSATKRYIGTSPKININLKKNQTAQAINIDNMKEYSFNTNGVDVDVITEESYISYSRGLHHYMSVQPDKEEGSVEIKTSATEKTLISYETSDKPVYANIGDKKISYFDDSSAEDEPEDEPEDGILESNKYYEFSTPNDVIDIKIAAKHSLIMPSSLLGSTLTVDFIKNKEVKMTKSFNININKGIRFIDSGMYSMRVKIAPNSEDSITTLYVFPKSATKRYIGTSPKININLKKNQTAQAINIDIMKDYSLNSNGTDVELIKKESFITYPRGLHHYISVLPGYDEGSVIFTTSATEESLIYYETSDEPAYANFGDKHVNYFGGNGLSAGAIVGIILAVIIVIAIVVGGIFFAKAKGMFCFGEGSDENVDV